MQEIWKNCKSYFGDGFVPGSSPFRYDVHVCDIQRPAVKSANHRYGVELDEDALALFTIIGETRQPPCTCHDISALVSYVDARLQTLPATHPADYSLHTRKGDASVTAASVFAMRDALSWWAHWDGTVVAKDRWKHVYIAFCTITDDVQIPPHHLVDGTWRYLGHSLAHLLEGLRSEGMHPDDVRLAEMYLCRQYICEVSVDRS